MYKKILYGVGILFVCILVFLAISFASFSLPNKSIRKHIDESYEYFIKEGEALSMPFLEGEKEVSTSIALDYYTDAIILGVAYDADEGTGKTNIERATSNSYYDDLEGLPHERSLNGLRRVVKEHSNTNKDYTRYWFGSMDILRFLLLFFNLQGIRFINMFIAGMLMFFTLHIMTKKIGIRYSIAFFCSFFFMGIVTIPISLQFFPLYCITLITTLIILLLYDKYNNTSCFKYIFLLVGAVTAFLDLLSYPLISLGMPLIVLLVLEHKNKKKTIKEIITNTILFILNWGIGYFTVFMAKWTTASLILKRDEITSAIYQILFRVDYFPERVANYSRLDVVKMNFDIYFNNYTLVFILSYILINTGIVYLKCRKKRDKDKNIDSTDQITIDYKFIDVLALTALLPYIWYMIFSNHSYIHCFMTQKIQAITMFAILCVVIGIEEFYYKS